MLGTMKFRMELGALVRSSIVGELKLYCHRHGMDLDLVESKGFISSDYSIKIKGDADRLLKIQRWLKTVQDC